MPKRAPYFHVYLGLMVVFASYAMGMTMRVREARLHWNTPHGCSRKVAPPAPVVSGMWKPVVEKYAGGVCLLTGKISYLDDAGKPFRYDVAAYEQRGELAPDPNGPVFEKPFSGTAFHIGKGIVLTNDEVFNTSEVLISVSSGSHSSDVVRVASIKDRRVYEVFSDVRAFFPNRPEPFQMQTRGFRFVHSVPEFTFDLNGADVPALKVYDHDDNLNSSTKWNDRVGRKLLLLWQPTTKKADASWPLKLMAAETSIGFNLGSSFWMNNLQEGPLPPHGAPIFNEQGVVIGITGPNINPSEVASSSFNWSNILLQRPVVMGETYGLHLAHRKAGQACTCESNRY